MDFAQVQGVRRLASGSPVRLLHCRCAGLPNFWRARSPACGDELVLCKETNALSKPYALTIVQRQHTLSPDRLDGFARSLRDSYVHLKNSL